MTGMRSVAVAGFQLALGGMLSCSASDPNTVIGAAGSSSGNTAGASGAPMGAAGAPSSAAGAATTGAGAGGAPVQAGGGGGAFSASGSGGVNSSGGGALGGSGGAVVTGGTGGGAMSSSLCTPSGNQFDCNNVLNGMDGYLNADLANGPSEGSDAHQFNCTNSEAAPVIFKEKHWQLMGTGITANAMYKVALHFYGVVECKTYNGGTPTSPARTDSETVSTSVIHNLWLNSAADDQDHWNTYGFTVTSASSSVFPNIGPQTNPPSPANSYAINQCPGSKGEGHFTYRIDYDTSIVVPGGSFINYIEYDTNCRMIANCGAVDAGQSCNGPYNFVNSVTQAVPNTNALTLMQPLANTANPPSRGQWWLVDVTSVTAM